MPCSVRSDSPLRSIRAAKNAREPHARLKSPCEKTRNGSSGRSARFITPKQKAITFMLWLGLYFQIDFGVFLTFTAALGAMG